MSLRLISIFSLLLLSITINISAYSQDIQPTDEEQLMLELINHARINPAVEGIRLANHPDPDIQGAMNFFGVDRDEMVNAFAAYPSRPPLAMNLLLTQAARRHSADLRDNNFQGHDGTDGSTLGTRVTDTGYLWQRIGENVFSFGRSIEHAHAGFVVDWGVPSLGHRQNTLEFEGKAHFTELGIGILAANTNAAIAGVGLSAVGNINAPGVSPQQTQDVGPLLVTIDFATTFNPVPNVLGVVYEDQNNNEFYDIGEGKGNFTLSVVGTNQSAATFNSGGYRIEVSTPGIYTLELSGAELSSPIQKTFEIAQDNVKVDFIIPPFTFVGDWMMY